MSPTQVQDAEANAFAMELLMPFDWIVRDCAGLCLTDDEGIAKLAKRYRVPASVMAVRIGEVRRELEMTGDLSSSTTGISASSAEMNPNQPAAKARVPG